MSSSCSANKPLIALSELRELQGWLIWRYETHNGESKPRKVPYYADGGRRHGQQGRAKDRSKLTSFAAACSAATTASTRCVSASTSSTCGASSRIRAS